MLFIDCSEWCKRHNKNMDDLLRAGWKVGVAWQDGRPFRQGDYIRLNLALPRSRVEEAFRRIRKYVY
jgi:cystathionine beta-lyase